ncbi:Piso0_002884 [Millerozyma farinosa CBS 7064]|uniref:Piso0_002884 protein n=1 Tax=Pichia sorbitophila (strain ATCC MYA-4447 / BCRC 22081 / CBS 7064 / NBRC 10061 / NRRL Y-12695) TaxID=559304 RepID=G8YGK6_PICSO|nr:Piso0_002884 [Millerozyma farinosa CBS 7064]CCE80558.1 Piso0_002884 [Millerozyma farinosa CBS 7064]
MMLYWHSLTPHLSQFLAVRFNPQGITEVEFNSISPLPYLHPLVLSFNAFHLTDILASVYFNKYIHNKPRKTMHFRIVFTFLILAGSVITLNDTVRDTEFNEALSKNESRYSSFLMQSVWQKVKYNKFSAIIAQVYLGYESSKIILKEKFTSMLPFLKDLPYLGQSARSENYTKFDLMQMDLQVEALTALRSFSRYSANIQAANMKRRTNFRKLPKQQQRLCHEAGYSKRLLDVDHVAEKNQQLLNEIRLFIMKEMDMKESHIEILQKSKKKYSPSSSNFRVIEGLLHYLRDWHPDFRDETREALQYIISQLRNIVPLESRNKTCVIVPGSGVGRIAHEIAIMGSGYGTKSNSSEGESQEAKFRAVYAVENSGIMHILHRFIYKGSANTNFDIYPHLHAFSNQVNSFSQLRKYTIPFQKQPDNLNIILGDFRNLDIYREMNCESVIVITMYLIDTASNMLDYLKAIENISKPQKSGPIRNGYWINVGPLKYGSSPLIELNLDELQNIRERLGWNDISTRNTLDEPAFEKKLMGYLTDRQSLWQAYYAVTMWCSQRKENSVLVE